MVDEYKQMRSTLFDTLVEFKSLRQLHKLGNVEDNVRSDADGPQNNLKQRARSPSELEVESNRKLKRPRRSCAGNEAYNDCDDENEEIIVEEGSESKNQSSTIDLSSELDPQPVKNSSQEENNNTVEIIKLARKNFALAGKKRKNLISLCRKEGIDETGSDKVLKERINRFADYWKSECDREVHKPANVIVREFRNQEARRARKETMMNNSFEKRSITKMNQSREALGSSEASNSKVVITSGNARFDDAFRQVYREMIEQLCIREGHNSASKMIEHYRERKLRNEASGEDAHDVMTNHDIFSPNMKTTPSVLLHSQNTPTIIKAPMSAPQVPPEIPTSSTPISQDGTEEANGNGNGTSSVKLHRRKIVNPYKKSTTHSLKKRAPLISRPKVLNPYRKPTVVKPSPPPPLQSSNTARTFTTSNLKSSMGSRTQMNQNSIAMSLSQCKQSKRKSPTQNSMPNCLNGDNDTGITSWTCQLCTYANEVKSWSRTRQKCAMCFTDRPVV